MKLWIDDLRPAPEGYVWCKSVNETKEMIEDIEKEQQYFHDMAFNFLHSGEQRAYHNVMSLCNRRAIELIDVDHDSGDYNIDGGDYIRLLDWLEETGRNYPIRIHSMNPVGVENMRRIIQRNGWKEIR
jgi:hypothetical protein